MDLVTPDIGLIFWTTVSFGILYFVLAKFAWKPILGAVNEREKSIKDALSAAEKAKDEMENLKSDNEKILNDDQGYWEFSDNDAQNENLPPLSRKFSISSIDSEVDDIAVFESGWTLLTRNINRKIRSVIFNSSELNKLYYYKNESLVFSKIFSESINWLLRSGISSENYFRMNRDYFQQGEMAYLSGTRVGIQNDSLGF